MKKKIVSALMVAAMVVTAFAGCGSDKGGTSTQGGDKTSKSSGKVYMLNFKPETDEAWQNLAETYTDQTGVEVNVLTAADGQYNTTLQSEMAKSDAPTIFNVGNSSAAQTWNDYTYDLKDSELYKHLTDKSLVINYDDKVAAIANCYECYGLIYNKTILEGYCGMDGAVVSSVDEINNFDTLKKVADDINSRIDDINKELGTDLTEAFASAGLDDGSSWRFSGHLANMPLYYEFKDDGCDLTAGEESIKGTYLDNFKNVWDMYVSDSAADPKTLNSGALNAESEFGMGEAVFYQNGDWEFSPLTNEENGYAVTADDLSMMPIYFGVDDENEGLCVGTENYWAVNWDWFSDKIRKANRPVKVLNLFAYTGGATLAAAAAGASVTHVDASKGRVNWAKENAQLSGLREKPIRWLVDDCVKFVEREIRRGNHYDGIIMDPPSYGRGPKGEIWKIEEKIYPFIELCTKILSDDPLFFLVNSYTTGLQPAVLTYMLETQVAAKFGGKVVSDEIGLPVSSNGLVLPCGASGRWEK